MTVIEVLLLLFFNLLVCFGLLAIAYYFAFLPMKDELKSLRVASNKRNSQYLGGLTVPSPSEYSVLPDIDDIPEEAFYGDDEPDYKTTPEEVEDAIAQRSFNTYNDSRTTSKQQLGSLKM